MGIGDELMVTGRVRDMVTRHPHIKRVAIIDVRKSNGRRWHDIWRDNPLMVQPGETMTEQDAVLADHGGNRPYIKELVGARWVWRESQPTPGEIYGMEKYEEYTHAARGHVIVHPALKPGASPSKQWSFENWLRLVREYPQVKWMQIGERNTPMRLPVPFMETPDFRAAAAALKGAKAAVLHEGGLHHAAAAVGLRAVVLFGGFISPKCTGYTTHINLFKSHGEFTLGCGYRNQCVECNLIMRRMFSPLYVYRELEKLL